MAKPTPPWQAHDAVNYDRDMATRCAALLGEIVADPARRRDVLADPRNLHGELFAAFAPPAHAEYAGIYRGTPGTTLAARKMSSKSQLEPGVDYEFCLPAEVSARMDALLKNTQAWIGDASTDDYGKLIGLTYTFC